MIVFRPKVCGPSVSLGIEQHQLLALLLAVFGRAAADGVAGDHGLAGPGLLRRVNGALQRLVERQLLDQVLLLLGELLRVLDFNQLAEGKFRRLLAQAFEPVLVSHQGLAPDEVIRLDLDVLLRCSSPAWSPALGLRACRRLHFVASTLRQSRMRMGDEGIAADGVRKRLSSPHRPPEESRRRLAPLD